MRRDPLVELPQALTRTTEKANARFLLGVDGGATKTLAAVLDLHDRRLYLGHGGPSNQDAVGAKAAGVALLGAAGEAIERAGMAEHQLDAAVLAIAGADTDAVASHVRSGGSSSSGDWIVVNDVVGAWATATHGLPGVGVISGTGSNVLGVGHDLRTWRAGGWGQVLGDEGSGYWLAVQSIKAALHDRDLSGPETALSDAVLAFFAVESVEELAELLYDKPLTKGEIAAFAVETARVAQAKDAVARELYDRAAVELGRQVTAVIRQTALEGSFPVGLIGSAFKAGDIFVKPLTRTIHELAPDARVSVVGMAPVGGCLVLAARAAGCADAIAPRELGRLIGSALAEAPER